MVRKCAISNGVIVISKRKISPDLDTSCLNSLPWRFQDLPRQCFELTRALFFVVFLLGRTLFFCETPPGILFCTRKMSNLILEQVLLFEECLRKVFVICKLPKQMFFCLLCSIVLINRGFVSFVATTVSLHYI
jgi:hypothetical protein